MVKGAKTNTVPTLLLNRPPPLPYHPDLLTTHPSSTLLPTQPIPRYPATDGRKLLVGIHGISDLHNFLLRVLSLKTH